MKKFILNSFYSILSWFIPIVVMFVSVPIFMKYLGADLYGTYILLNNVVYFISLINFGTGDSVLKYTSEVKKSDENKISDILNTALSINLITSLMFFIIILLFKDEIIIKFLKLSVNSYSVKLLIVVALIFVVNFLSNNFISFFKAFQIFKINMILTIVNTLVLNVGLIVLVLFKIKLEGIFVYTLSIAIINLVIYIWLVKKSMPKYKIKLYINKELFLNIFNFSKFSFLTGFCSLIMANSDKLFIGYFFNSALVAYYTIPSNLSMKLQNFFSSALNVVFPKVSELYKSKDYRKLKIYYYKLLKVVILALILICIPACMYSYKLLLFWVGKVTADKCYVILITSFVAYAFLSLNSLPYYYFNGLGMPKFNFICGFVGAILTLILNIILIPKFNMLGAAIATLVACIICSLYSLHIMNIKFQNKTNILILVKYSFMILIYLGVCYINLIFIKNLLILIFICLIDLIVFIVLTLVFKLVSRDEILDLKNVK